MAKPLVKVKVGELMKAERMNEIIERINELQKRVDQLESKTPIRMPPKVEPLYHIDSVQ